MTAYRYLCASQYTDASAFEAGLRLLPGVTYSRILEKKDPAARAESLCCRLALRSLLCESYGEAEGSRLLLTLSSDEFGKPVFESSGGLYVSFSHKCGIGAAAVSTGRVGIDIECPHLTDRRRAVLVASRYFTKSEADSVRAAGDSDFFCRLWTKKESLFKAVGNGSLAQLLGDGPADFPDSIEYTEDEFTEDGVRYILSLCRCID